jgi:hypothetical protein
MTDKGFLEQAEISADFLVGVRWQTPGLFLRVNKIKVGKQL